MIHNQRTIGKTIVIAGSGIHTGEHATLTLHPASVDHGVVFIKSGKIIKACTSNVIRTSFGTVLGSNDQTVMTVEHLLSALSALAIDNVLIEVEGGEIPILDGSAAVFITELQAAGILEQNSLRTYLKIKSKVMVGDRSRYASLEPYDGFKLSMTIYVKHPACQPEKMSQTFDMSKNDYTEMIAQARTYGFMSQWGDLRKAGLAMGSDLTNTLAFGEESILNEGGMRIEQEPCRHKILDAIGDLSLVGKPILGHFKGFSSGHGLNIALLKKCLEQDAFELVRSTSALDSVDL